MKETLKGILTLLIYYSIESLVVGFIVTTVWVLLLQNLFNLNISYFQWVGIVFIVKLIGFNIFSALATLASKSESKDTSNTTENEI